MVSRYATQWIQELASLFPAVLILGPRQCGKTTLVRHFISGHYFDMERPSDHALFSGDTELLLSQIDGPVVIDEAQNYPELFQVLRSLIDDKREKNGRFYLLGSVNPELVRQVTESLAGRIGIVELTPFLYSELSASTSVTLDEHWLAGGYPPVALASAPRQRELWLNNYLMSVVQRDLPRAGVTASPIELRRFIQMAAHIHGNLLNSSELGRSLGVTYHTVNRYLDLFEGHFLIRRLLPWHTNPGKRLVRSPKLYIRDSGLFHSLLGIHTPHDLLTSPQRGNSWEGLLIEEVIAREQLENPSSRFWFYRTATGVEIDLLIERNGETIGLEFKTSLRVTKADCKGLIHGIQDRVISRGFVVYAGDRSYPVIDKIEALPATDLLLRGIPSPPSL